jgi:Ca2+/Na+ antiporter
MIAVIALIHAGAITLVLPGALSSVAPTHLDRRGKSMRELFGLLIALMLVGIPVRQIMLRTGFSQWWALVVVVPVVNLIALWVFAFSNWPRQSPDATSTLPSQR